MAMVTAPMDIPFVLSQNKLKGESSCKRMGGNLFTHAMSAAEVQSHEVWLNRKNAKKTSARSVVKCENRKLLPH